MLGAGIRNSPLVSAKYGADERGRVIHSQYLQLLADGGFPALALYLALLASAWLGVRRTRRLARNGTRLEDRRAAGVARGVETAMAVFCIGALFLSLEVFELPWLLLLLGAEVDVLYVPAGRELEPATADFARRLWSQPRLEMPARAR